MMEGGGLINMLPVAAGDHRHPDGDVADKMRQMHLKGDGALDAGPYPQRPGEQNCAFYMRSGLCKFGMTCKFNHPIDRNLVVAATKLKGEYPERIGQPECQYYIKTGTCKFGATCKFHHPKDVVNIVSKVQLNVLGYPLRPNEIECSYYLRTGHCKFGNTCKFHHPQPASLLLSVHGSPIHPSVHSPTTPQPYQGGLANWPVTTMDTFLPSTRWQGNLSHNQLVFPNGSEHHHGWNAPAGKLHSRSTMENPNEIPDPGNLQQCKTDDAGDQGLFNSHDSSSVSTDLYSFRKGSLFPERPGEPECQFYMKTGDCKFGTVCRFHHPRERSVPTPDCMLSPLGLPLRPGEPLCVFYSRYGICKFGPNCKFDHPMENSANSIPASSSVDISPDAQPLGLPLVGAGNLRQAPMSHELGLEDEHADVE